METEEPPGGVKNDIFDRLNTWLCKGVQCGQILQIYPGKIGFFGVGSFFGDWFARPRCAGAAGTESGCADGDRVSVR